MSDRTERKRAAAVDALRHLAAYAELAADTLESGSNPGTNNFSANLLSLVGDAVPSLAVVDTHDFNVRHGLETA